MDESVPPELAEHPDRVRWNAKHGADGRVPSAHPLAAERSARPRTGPSSTSRAGRPARRCSPPTPTFRDGRGHLRRRARPARRRGPPPRARRADHARPGRPRDVAPARPRVRGRPVHRLLGPRRLRRRPRRVAPGGVLAWEAFTTAARRDRPHLPAEWCLAPGEPASLLPDGFRVLDQRDVQGGKRRVLARS
ncbi:hypothetical protein [Actinomadura sp. CNU-125]|uniref:hypothetical protein n=1 Tax=Actinomadura sp. CNU-125 TaxID=1904961 RepID=UPI0021CC775B|nr:hypothetical protein [Actinomadura sp. CNU-125]